MWQLKSNCLRSLLKKDFLEALVYIIHFVMQFQLLLLFVDENKYVMFQCDY